MAKPNVIIPVGEGINCDLETEEAFRLAFEHADARVDRILLADLIESKEIADYQIMAIPGGFSFGDDIAAGKGYAVAMKTKLGEAIYRFIDSGNLLIGICNGAQISLKYPIPGFDEDGKQVATLTYNDSGRFRCEWVTLKNSSGKCVWTSGIDEIDLPIAHGEGKFYVSDQNVLKKLYDDDRIALKYIGYNPNGSVDDIAGICDATGRSLILMPHPERYVYALQHPQSKRQQIEGRLPNEGAGLIIFRNAVNYFR